MIRIALSITLVFLMTAFLSAAGFVQHDLPTKATINKILFLSSNYGFAVTNDGELLQTSNAGKTWKVKDMGKRAITDIHILGRDGYMVGEKGLLMKSVDAGVSWRDISLDLKFNFSGVGIVNDSTIIVCGTDQHSMSKTKGVLFISRDRGNTWQKQRHWGNGYTDVATWPTKKIYLIAIKQIFHSINAGLHFFHGTYEGDDLCFGLDFQDDWGFMVGANGYFGSSTTHGREWEQKDFGIDKDLFAVGMMDHFSGVTVGQDGIIVFFNDSGNRYTVMNSGVKADLKTVAITDDYVFTAGNDGTFFSYKRNARAGQ
ncbi:MAG: YCF48-related protein [Candidatus Zixiibacteriota bacterium]